MCDDIYSEFQKLSNYLNEKDKDHLKSSSNAEIKRPYPGRNFTKWKQTDTAIFYAKPNEIKIYCISK